MIGAKSKTRNARAPGFAERAARSPVHPIAYFARCSAKSPSIWAVAAMPTREVSTVRW